MRVDQESCIIMLDIPPRISLLVALLVALPIGLYWFDRGDPIAGLTLLSVLVILSALYLSFRPPESSSPSAV